VNLPNAITLGRLCAVPIVVYMILSSQFIWAFWIFVLAGASDAVDGYLAKAFGKTTTLGSYLDPIADKALVVAVYVTLGVQGEIPSWLVILVVFRDALIVGGVLLMWIFGYELPIRPIPISKVNTAVQIFYVVVVLADYGVGLNIHEFNGYLAYVVGLTTLLSGAGYLTSWMQEMANMEDTR
jgi:cardiolipin synthase